MTPESFTPHRSALLGLAYRMLGSVASAEDVVQETWLRYAEAEDVDHPGAWLKTVCTRLCLDEVRSARARREQYVGPWLPEPWVGEQPPPGLLGESLTMAFLVVLEQLSAKERAAWLLREVFDDDYAHIADVLHTSQAACRQLVKRANTALAAGRPRFEADSDQQMALVAAFGAACTSGDTQGLEAVLADNAVWVGDGGGRRTATRRPVRGASAVARLAVGLFRKLPEDCTIEPARVNARPGVIVRLADGQPYAVCSIDFADGKIAAITQRAQSGQADAPEGLIVGTPAIGRAGRSIAYFAAVPPWTCSA